MNHKLASSTLAIVAVLSGAAIAFQDPAPVSRTQGAATAGGTAGGAGAATTGGTTGATAGATTAGSVTKDPASGPATAPAQTGAASKSAPKTRARAGAKHPKGTAAARPPKPPKPPKPAWQQFKLNPKTSMFLDFTDSNPDMIFSIFSRTSGITILKDPAFKGPITVTSAKSVGLNEAFDILNTVLGFSQYELQKKGNLLVVEKQAPAAPPMVMHGPPPGPPPAAPDDDKPVLKVYSIQFASASQVARVVNEVFSQEQLEAIVQQLQSGGGMQMGQPGMMMGRPPGQSPPKVVRASSEDYSNSVIVNAPKKYQDMVELLIKQLDKSAEQPLASETFQLKHVPVDQVIQAIQDVLTANTPTGRGAGKGAEPPQNPFGFFNPFSNNQPKKVAGGQTAVEIKQTNSVIVTATKENLEMIRKLIISIDQPSIYAGTTFVVNLHNAKASDVATLLNTAFAPRKDNQNNFDPFFFLFGDTSNQQDKNKQLTDLDDQGNVVNIRDLTSKVNITADPNTNSLIVVTAPSNMRLVQKVIDAIDKIAPQVMIETVIVEANLDKTTKLGVEWNFLQGKVLNNPGLQGSGSSNFGLQGAATPNQGLNYTINAATYKAFVNAIATDTRFKILSTPRIFTSNNVKAEIDVSQKVPYISSQQTGLVGNTSNYQFLPVGVILDVTPRITSAGDVTMDVTQSADDLQGFTNFNAPIVNHRQAMTTVSVKDGETIILGGIIRTSTNKTDTKIPILGDLPIIGHLFKSTNNETTQTELMVLLTPHIVRDNAEALRIREAAEKELSKSSKGALEHAVKDGKAGG